MLQRSSPVFAMRKVHGDMTTVGSWANSLKLMGFFCGHDFPPCKI